MVRFSLVRLSLLLPLLFAIFCQPSSVAAQAVLLDNVRQDILSDNRERLRAIQQERERRKKMQDKDKDKNNATQKKGGSATESAKDQAHA